MELICFVLLLIIFDMFTFPVGFLKTLSTNSATSPPAFDLSTAVLGGSAGMTQIVSNSSDDASINIGDIGFDFPFYNSTYRNNIFVGSNSYLTFGFGSNAYSSLSRTSPGRGLLVAAADRSYQKIFVRQDTPGEKFRVRFEGSTGSSGAVGSPTMVWEATLFVNGTIQLVTGILNSTTGVSTLSSGDNINFTDFVPAANSKYAFIRESATQYTFLGTVPTPPAAIAGSIICTDNAPVSGSGKGFEFTSYGSFSLNIAVANGVFLNSLYSEVIIVHQWIQVPSVGQTGKIEPRVITLPHTGGVVAVSVTAENRWLTLGARFEGQGFYDCPYFTVSANNTLTIVGR